MQFKRAVFLSVFFAASVAFAADDSKPVTLAETPAAVQKTITAQIGDGKLAGIERVNEAGGATFDVSYTSKTGAEHGFTVTDDGMVSSVEVALAETPAAVQKTIQAQADGGEVEGIDKKVQDGEFLFDVETGKDGVEKNFTVAGDGTLSSIQVALADTPDTVQKTIQAQAGGADVESIDKKMEEEEISFDVEVAKDGVKKSFTVEEDGTLSSIEIALADTPPAVHKAIQELAVGWRKMESLRKNVEDTEPSYDVELSYGSQTRRFTVSEEGALTSMEVSLAKTPQPAQAAIAKQVAGGILKSIDESFDPSGNTFDVGAVLKDGSRVSFTIGADGSYLSLKITLDKASGPAQEMIKKQVGDGTLKSIDESFDPPTTYDVVAVMQDGTKKSFTVGDGGGLRSEEVTLDQTTAPARATITGKIGNGKILRIDKAWAEKKEDGVVPFEVQGIKDGKPFNFSVGPKGKFLGMDE